MTDEERERLFLLAAGLWPKAFEPGSEGVSLAWRNGLSAFPYQDGFKALESLAKESDQFPTLAKLVKALREIQRDREMSAQPRRLAAPAVGLIQHMRDDRTTAMAEQMTAFRKGLISDQAHASAVAKIESVGPFEAAMHRRLVSGQRGVDPGELTTDPTDAYASVDEFVAALEVERQALAVVERREAGEDVAADSLAENVRAAARALWIRRHPVRA